MLQKGSFDVYYYLQHNNKILKTFGTRKKICDSDLVSKASPDYSEPHFFFTALVILKVLGNLVGNAILNALYPGKYNMSSYSLKRKRKDLNQGK